MEIGAPEYLPLLVLLAAVALIARRSLAGLGRARRWLALTARCVVVALIALALAEPSWTALTERVEVILVVDRSRSIPAEQAREAAAVVEATLQRASPARPVKVVAFAGDAAIEVAAEAPRAAPDPTDTPLARERTSVEAGLRRAVDALEPGTRRRLVLLTDGNDGAGDAQAALARARRVGAVVDVIGLTYRHAEEALVEKVVTPATARPGEPFKVRVVTHAAAPTPALLRVWVDGALAVSREVVLQAGANVEELTLTSPAAGFARIEAALELPRGTDALPQNDVAYGFVHVPGAAEVLLVSEAAREPVERPLAATLAAAGLRVRQVAPDALPLSPSAMRDLHAVILDDVPAWSLSLAQQRALEAAVADQGVGLIMIGGPDAFGAGAWGGTPVEDALPVRMDPRTTAVMPRTGLVLVLDRSGSMDGEKLEMAKAAARATASTLGQQDLLGVVSFDTGAEWTVPLGSAGDHAGIRARIAGLASGGGTDVSAGLRVAFAGLRAADAAVKHIIVLTDGRTQGDDPVRAAIAARAAGITVSTVALGPDADEDLLRRLARAGAGRFHDVDRPRDVPRIFVKEVQRVARPLIREAAFTPALRGDDAALAALGGLPPLGGLVVTEAKPRAAVPLAGPDGVPVLARWQYGVGRALAFTSDAGPRWAGAWVAWPGYQAFWAQALRWVARDVEEQGLAVAARRDGDRARVTVDAIDAAGDLADGLVLTARARAPDGSLVETPLTQRGAGRYEGEWAAKLSGAYEVTVVARAADGRERPVGAAGLVVPYPDEFRHLRADTAALEELARAGGGRLLRPWEVVEEHVDLFDTAGLPDRDGAREGWPALLAAALVLFLLDVAVRRVAFSLPKTAVQPRRLPPAPPLPPLDLGPPDPPSGPPAPPTAPPTVRPDLPDEGAEDAPTTSRLLAAKRRVPRG